MVRSEEEVNMMSSGETTGIEDEDEDEDGDGDGDEDGDGDGDGEEDGAEDGDRFVISSSSSSREDESVMACARPSGRGPSRTAGRQGP